MKYWWIKKYQNLEVKMLPDLLSDIRYFLVMPKNYLKIHNEIKDLDVDSLREEELLIELYVLVSSKNIKNNRLILIIKRLLSFPDVNLPLSDYSLKEMLEEISNLKINPPIQEKMNYNNVVACYNCEQIFYVDNIRAVNKRDYCLCPYCGKHNLYFDNDYVPMNYSFLKLASLYYGTSSLGCKFSNIQNILRKNIKVTMGNVVVTSTLIQNNKKKIAQKKVVIDFDFSRILKFNSMIESDIIKKYYDAIMKIDGMMEYETTIVLEKIPLYQFKEISFLILLSIMEALSKTIYLKNIQILCGQLEVYQEFRNNIKIISSYSR